MAIGNGHREVNIQPCFHRAPQWIATTAVGVLAELEHECQHQKTGGCLPGGVKWGADRDRPGVVCENQVWPRILDCCR